MTHGLCKCFTGLSLYLIGRIPLPRRSLGVVTAPSDGVLLESVSLAKASKLIAKSMANKKGDLLRGFPSKILKGVV